MSTRISLLERQDGWSCSSSGRRRRSCGVKGNTSLSGEVGGRLRNMDPLSPPHASSTLDRGKSTAILCSYSLIPPLIMPRQAPPLLTPSQRRGASRATVQYDSEIQDELRVRALDYQGLTRDCLLGATIRSIYDPSTGAMCEMRIPWKAELTRSTLTRAKCRARRATSCI